MTDGIQLPGLVKHLSKMVREQRPMAEVDKFYKNDVFPQSVVPS